MSYDDIPFEVNAECSDREWHVGETVRIRHIHRKDGSACSAKKSAALAITRKSDGWWWNCFRCGEHGFKRDSAVRVEQVEKDFALLRYVPQFKTVASVNLPNDFIKMKDTPSLERAVPNVAYKWMWDNNCHGDVYQDFGIGWSRGFQRVIIPIHEPQFITPQVTKKKLVGWIGRDPRPLTKEERAERRSAKYILRKSKDYERIYFHASAFNDTYVIVEDCLSAMKIHSALGVNAIALLTTNVPMTMLLRLRAKKIILWLDNDQLTNMVMSQVKGTNMGLDIDYIHTEKDPKMYTKWQIMHYINSRR